LETLRLAHHFPTQMGSESMCKRRWFRPPPLTHLPYSAVSLAGCWFRSAPGVGSRHARSPRGAPWPLKPWDPWIPGNAEACGLLAAGQQTRPLVVSRGKPPCAKRRSPAVARGPGPPSEGRMPQPVPARPGGGRNLCVRTGTEELRGGNLMAARALPVRRGGRAGRAPRAPLPFN
jgi:hypothetical protein